MHPFLSAFDLDHTLFKVNSSFKFGFFLYEHGVFSMPVMSYLLFCYASHKLGRLSLANMQEKIFKRLFAGFSKPKLDSFVTLFLDRSFNDMTYLPAIDSLHEAQKNGHYTALLSSSPEFLVAEIAKRLNMHTWMATQYAVKDDGCFSHIQKVIEGKDKATYMQELASRLSLNQGCLIAYSDSILDLPFLQAAGRAVGVNPDRELRKICKQNGWAVI